MSRKPDQGGSRLPADAAQPSFDDQQARLLSILARRAGKPVTFDELRAAGFEFPASLVSELELAGVDIERCRSADPQGRAVRAVRLPSAVKRIPDLAQTAVETREPSPRPEAPQPSPPPEPASSPPATPESASSMAPPREPVHAAAPDWGPVRIYRGSLRRALASRWAKLAPNPDAERFAVPAPPPRTRRRPSTRLVATLALLVAVAITAAVVAASISARKAHPQLVTRHHRRTATSAPAGTSRPGVHSTRTRSRAPAAPEAGLSSGAIPAQRSGPRPLAGSTAPSAGSSASPGSNATEVMTQSSGANSPGAAVQAFYEAAAQHRYSAAWELADPNMRAEVGGYAAFEDQMSSVRSISFHELYALQQTSDSATVAVRTTSVQTDRTQQCWGTVRTVQQAGSWLLDGISIHCI